MKRCVVVSCHGQSVSQSLFAGPDIARFLRRPQEGEGNNEQTYLGALQRGVARDGREHVIEVHPVCFCGRRVVSIDYVRVGSFERRAWMGSGADQSTVPISPHPSAQHTT